jgi:hypothetical protein
MNSSSGIWAYFFTHVFVFESHFISVIFAHSALVFGGSAANAGAATADKIPVMIAMRRALDMVFPPV